MYVCICVRASVCVGIMFISLRMYGSKCTLVHANICVCVRVYVRVCVYLCIYISVFVFLYLYLRTVGVSVYIYASQNVYLCR